MSNEITSHIKYLKFLNICIEHQDYLKTVQEAWEEEIYGNPLYILHQKIKKVCKTLNDWSRQTYGDIYEVPVSPSLFIINAELLCKMLNNLHDRQGYMSYYMDVNGQRINHLSFADNTTMFCNGGKRPLKMIIKTLATYEVSGQLINKGKSCFIVANKTKATTINRLKDIKGVNHQKFQSNILDALLSLKKISHYSEIVNCKIRS